MLIKYIEFSLFFLSYLSIIKFNFIILFKLQIQCIFILEFKK